MGIGSAAGRSGGQGVAGQLVARLELDDGVAGLRQLPGDEALERVVHLDDGRQQWHRHADPRSQPEEAPGVLGQAGPAVGAPPRMP